MIRTLILAAVVMAGFATSTATAQAQSIGFGYGGGSVGVGGRNFGVYVGPRGGFYGPGYYGGYGYSGYYGPRVYGGTTYDSSPYYTPSQVYSGSTVVSPAIPFGPAAPMFNGGVVVLMNPATNPDSVEYLLNGEQFVMRPGQSQRFAHDRDWIIDFDRGDGSNFARYGLKSATYKFKPTANGWELFEQAESRPAPGTVPPATALPAKPVNPPQPADEPRPRDLVPPPVPDAEQPKDLTKPSEAPETVIRSRNATKPN